MVCKSNNLNFNAMVIKVTVVIIVTMRINMFPLPILS